MGKFAYDAADSEFPQSWNRYAYVNGNPLGAVDPLGLHAACPQEGTCDDFDPVGCTIDGMHVGCGMALQTAALPGGGAMTQCPADGCPQAGTYISPANGLPYQLTNGIDGWQYTARNGEQVFEPNLWEELDLPDFNLMYGGQPVGSAVLSWRAATLLPSISTGTNVTGPQVPQLSAPQTPSSGAQHSRSYAAFLACEWGQTVGNDDHLGTWAFLNGSTIALLGAGNLKKGLTLGIAAMFYNFTEGYAIRSACTAAAY